VAILIDSIEAVQAAVRGNTRVLAVGNGSKPRLSAAGPEVTRLDMTGLSGVVDYDPRELTISALAGTPIAEVQAVLAQHGQRLPFDPLFPSCSSVGGVVATGGSGPNAYGSGVLRDFVIEAQFVEGTGMLVRGGARVVKSAAGFDLPKLMVGSIGRLGVLVELSFKVFPDLRATATAIFDLESLEDAFNKMSDLARSALSIEALDLDPPARLLVRLRSSSRTAAERAAAVIGRRPTAVLADEQDDAIWRASSELAWADPAGQLVRVAVRPRLMPRLLRTIAGAGARARASLGGNVAWIEWPADSPIDVLHGILGPLDCAGLVLAGSDGPPLIGRPGEGPFAERIRRALDPDRRFPGV
jgi:glycolate oxidase FAD binding subunit